MSRSATTPNRTRGAFESEMKHATIRTRQPMLVASVADATNSHGRRKATKNASDVRLFRGWFGAIPMHMMLLAMLLIGAVLHDRVAQFLKRMAVLGMLLACLFVWSGEAERCSTLRPEVFMIYPGFILLVATIYAYWVRNPWYRVIPLLILAGWLADLGGRGYGSLRKSVAGLDELAWGMACLLIGLLVSLWKLGLPQTWLAWFLKLHGEPLVPTTDTGRDRTSDG